MYHDRFWNLLAKKLSGEASPEEISELISLIKTYPELSYPAQNVADLWKLKPLKNEESAEAAFQKLFSQIKPTEEETGANETIVTTEIEKEPNNHKKRWFIIGLSVILLTTTSIFFWPDKRSSTTSETANQVQEIFTRPGTRTKVVLPDSSTVWLNAGSKLTYSQPFGIAQRKVTLSGEAYFDVTKNKIPFIIYTNGAQIKVLGTAFNVRSYPPEKRIETSLVHGRVEVSLDKNPGDKFYLKPNQKLTLNISPVSEKKKRRKEMTPIAVYSELSYLDDTTIAETSWMENKLVFDDESFDEVANKMQRWYGVSIQIKYKKLKEERYTGVFEKENVWQALEAMKLITPFHYTVKNNEIIITH